jgi:predicted PurR-regulated permease PerM
LVFTTHDNEIERSSASRRREQYQSDRLFQRAMPIYLALLLAIITVVGIWMLLQLQHVLMIIFIAIIFASAISRPSAYLERLHVPRAIASLSIYLVSLAVVVAIGWFVIPPLLGQVTNLAEQTPEYADRYHDLRTRYDRLQQDYPELASFDEQVAGIRSRVVDAVGNRLIDLPTRTFGVFLDVLAVFVISMLLQSAREKILGLILSVTHPDHREQTEVILKKMWERVGFYVRAKIVVMVIIGAITYGALLLIGVPFALLLAIVVAFGEVIPRVGPWLARIPLLGIAALQGWETLGLAFLASIIIENAKGYAISPFVEGDQLDIHPLLVFVSVLVGAALAGPAGAFVAVPAAAMVQVLFEELILPWRRAQLADVEPTTPERAHSG